MATNPKLRDASNRRQSPTAEQARQAARCRRLAAGVSDRQASEVLLALADRYERGLGDADGQFA